MGERMRRYRQTNPERTRVWNEKYHQIRKAPVVYYLCKNQHLEHPHFMEVVLSSPDGLYLRDVVNRLDELRGRGLHLKYSWSSKRSYKTGYVWHDLSQDDLIVPVNGHEYILKGSELFEDNGSGYVGPSGSINVHDLKQLHQPDSANSQGDSSSSSSMNVKGNRAVQENEYYLTDQHPDSSSGGLPSESRLDGTSGSGDALSLVGCKDGKNRNAIGPSTQTEENVIVPRLKEAGTRSGSLKCDSSKSLQSCIALERQNSVASSGSSLVPSSSSSSKSSTRRKASVSELLNKADAKMINSFQIHEKYSPTRFKHHPEEDVPTSSSPRLNVRDMFIQLISCGSIPVKGHGFGLAHSNRPSFGNMNSPSSWYSGSTMPEEFKCMSNNMRLMGMHVKDKDQVLGSATERKRLNEGDGRAHLKTSSTNSGRSRRQLDPVQHKNEPDSQHMISISESLRSALSVRSRVSSDKDDTTQNTALAYNNRTAYSPRKFPSRRHPSIDQIDVITTEERISSGARVIIHSRASLDNNG